MLSEVMEKMDGVENSPTSYRYGSIKDTNEAVSKSIEKSLWEDLAFKYLRWIRETQVGYRLWAYFEALTGTNKLNTLFTTTTTMGGNLPSRVTFKPKNGFNCIPRCGIDSDLIVSTT